MESSIIVKSGGRGNDDGRNVSTDWTQRKAEKLGAQNTRILGRALPIDPDIWPRLGRSTINTLHAVDFDDRPPKLVYFISRKKLACYL